MSLAILVVVVMIEKDILGFGAVELRRREPPNWLQDWIQEIDECGLVDDVEAQIDGMAREDSERMAFVRRDLDPPQAKEHGDFCHERKPTSAIAEPNRNRARVLQQHVQQWIVVDVDR